jgi:hypothetical protein
MALRHPLEGPRLQYYQRFHPYGFPVDVRTNSPAVIKILAELWNPFRDRFELEPIRCEITVTPTDETECPPEPHFYLRPPIYTATCDRDNFTIVDFERGMVFTQLSEAAIRHPLFAGYFLLPSAITCICARYVTPIHGACVSWDSRGILLCGDSGAGKSTLAYSCARHGWTYTSDDGSFLLQESARRVVGNCYHVRMRPEAAAIFPEFRSLPMTPRAAGKPSIQMPTSRIPGILTSPSADIHAIVFLNRHHTGIADLLPYPREKARQAMLAMPYGMPEMVEIQSWALERLLSVPVLELRYQTLEDARRLLRALAEKVSIDGDSIAVGN